VIVVAVNLNLKNPDNTSSLYHHAVHQVQALDAEQAWVVNFTISQGDYPSELVTQKPLKTIKDETITRLINNVQVLHIWHRARWPTAVIHMKDSAAWRVDLTLRPGELPCYCDCSQLFLNVAPRPPPSTSKPSCATMRSVYSRGAREEVPPRPKPESGRPELARLVSVTLPFKAWGSRSGVSATGSSWLPKVLARTRRLAVLPLPKVLPMWQLPLTHTFLLIHSEAAQPRRICC
jgi:hypothetical protein